METVEVYKYILIFFKSHTFVPTVRELGEHFKCSTSTIHLRLKNLELKGDIIRKKDGSLYRLRNEIMRDLMMSIVGEDEDVYYLDEDDE